MGLRLDTTTGLAAMPPGPELCVASAQCHTDLTRLPALEVLAVVDAEARAVAHHQARLYAAVWEAALRNPTGDNPLARMDRPDEASVYEVGYCLGKGKVATGILLSHAYELVDRFPMLCAALLGGQIDLDRAQAFCVGVQELSEEHGRQVIAALLVKSRDMAIPRLRAEIVRHALALDSDYGDRVRAKALRRPNVRAVLNHDGSADVVMYNIAPDKAAGITGRLDHPPPPCRPRATPAASANFAP